jgi:hypothetical protein
VCSGIYPACGTIDFGPYECVCTTGSCPKGETCNLGTGTCG